MVTEVTKGVKVTVSTEYLSEYSSPMQHHYVFAYNVTIENQTDFAIQLERRHWFIHDSNAQVREVEGEGVVGQKPILEPGQQHSYVSGCNLKTSLGKMGGTYLMKKLVNDYTFDVLIPEFTLMAPFRNN